MTIARTAVVGSDAHWCLLTNARGGCVLGAPGGARHRALLVPRSSPAHTIDVKEQTTGTTVVPAYHVAWSPGCLAGSTHSAGAADAADPVPDWLICSTCESTVDLRH